MEHHYNAWQDQEDYYRREEDARAKRFWHYFRYLKKPNQAIRQRKFKCRRILPVYSDENDIPF